MQTAIRANDVGAEIRATFKQADGSALDISQATTKEFTLEDPDGNTVARAGTFFTDGIDGVLSYKLVAGDVPTPGIWHLQGHVIFGDAAEYRTNRARFVVGKNNNAPA